MIRFTRMVVGTSIGFTGGYRSVNCRANLLLYRMVENILLSKTSWFNWKLLEPWGKPMQIIESLLPESLPGFN